MKIVHQVLHMDKSIDRKKCVDSINKKLYPISKPLNSKTYEISNNNQLMQFIMEQPKLKIDYDYHFKYSEVGVWGSNYAAWINFLKTDKDYLIIFEDDVDCVEDFMEKIIKVIDNIPQDWDAFFFLTPEGNKEHYYRQHQHDIGLPEICQSYQGNWLGGYMMNRSGVQKLVNEVECNMIVDPIDIYMFYIQKVLNMYAFKPEVPSICYGVDLPTTIHNSKKIGE